MQEHKAHGDGFMNSWPHSLAAPAIRSRACRAKQIECHAAARPAGGRARLKSCASNGAREVRSRPTRSLTNQHGNTYYCRCGGACSWGMEMGSWGPELEGIGRWGGTDR